jgi:signal transduction histidine kinase
MDDSRTVPVLSGANGARVGDGGGADGGDGRRRAPLGGVLITPGTSLRDMSSTANDERFAPGGFVVAAVGFLLTRSATAASVTTDSTAAFLVGDVPFLVAGLGLSLFGVALGVSDRGADHARTVARWCLVGTAATGAAVAAALAGTALSGAPVGPGTRAFAFDILVAGAVGGTLTGVQVSRRRRHERDLSRRTARLTALNRILRHEVLNGVNVVRGYAELLETRPDGGEASADAAAVIERNADRIDEAVTEVGDLSRPGGVSAVSLSSAVTETTAAVSGHYPGAEVTVDDRTDDVPVRATGRLGDVLEHLLANAVEHADADRPRVTVTVRSDDATATVDVADDGPGLPDRQRRLLVDGALPRYDDPSAGFGLTVVRLVAEEIDADVAVGPGIDGDGTTVSLTLRRHDTSTVPASVGHRDGVPAGRLVDAAVAATLAGVVMGVAMNSLNGSIPIIGALYGVMTPLVGWVTHQFHSLVFGVAFVGLLEGTRPRHGRRWVASAALSGAGFGALLWFVAAGFVMPLWLRAVGIAAPVPSLGAVGLVGHLLWGSTHGAAYALLGSRHS